MDTDFTISGEEYFKTLDRRFFFVWLKSTQKQGQRAKSFDWYKDCLCKLTTVTNVLQSIVYKQEESFAD